MSGTDDAVRPREAGHEFSSAAHGGAQNAGLEQQVLGWVAGYGQLGENDDIGIEGARLLDPVSDEEAVAGQVSDSGVDLRQGETHLAACLGRGHSAVPELDQEGGVLRIAGTAAERDVTQVGCARQRGGQNTPEVNHGYGRGADRKIGGGELAELGIGSGDEHHVGLLEARGGRLDDHGVVAQDIVSATVGQRIEAMMRAPASDSALAR